VLGDRHPYRDSQTSSLRVPALAVDWSQERVELDLLEAGIAKAPHDGAALRRSSGSDPPE